MLSIRVLLILDVVLIIATVLSYQLWADRSIHLPNRSLKYLAKEMRLVIENMELISECWERLIKKGNSIE